VSLKLSLGFVDSEGDQGIILEKCVCKQAHHYSPMGAVKSLWKEEAGKDKEIANVLMLNGHKRQSKKCSYGRWNMERKVSPGPVTCKTSAVARLELQDCLLIAILAVNFGKLCTQAMFMGMLFGARWPLIGSVRILHRSSKGAQNYSPPHDCSAMSISMRIKT
jgi:hypothetical protein